MRSTYCIVCRKRSLSDQLRLCVVLMDLKMERGETAWEREARSDHRMAMGFAILGLRRGGISIVDPDCVAKSYPGFWDDLTRVEEAAGNSDTSGSRQEP